MILSVVDFRLAQASRWASDRTWSKQSQELRQFLAASVVHAQSVTAVSNVRLHRSPHAGNEMTGICPGKLQLSLWPFAAALACQTGHRTGLRVL